MMSAALIEEISSVPAGAETERTTDDAPVATGAARGHGTEGACLDPVENARGRAVLGGEYGRTLSILVVEDDVAVAELIRTILNQEPGWGATIVHDASAAREVFRHVRVEVMVVDVNLPGISGLELLALLRRDPHWGEPPVLLMSAVPDQRGIEGAVRDGLVTTFLRKPFDVDELVQRVHAAVAPNGAAAGR